jgi:hypothetical protein
MTDQHPQSDKVIPCTLKWSDPSGDPYYVYNCDRCGKDFDSDPYDDCLNTASVWDPKTGWTRHPSHYKQACDEAVSSEMQRQLDDIKKGTYGT